MRIVFTDKESKYIRSQRLARIATASKWGEPDVVPVGFDFDGEYFYVGSSILDKTVKYRNIMENPKVSLVIDDVLTAQGHHFRSIKIRGTADVVDREGYHGTGKYLRIKPVFKLSHGLNGEETRHQPRLTWSAERFPFTA